MENIPRIVYEDTMARFERIIKRLIILLAVSLLLLFGSNLAWLHMWNQYDYSDVTVDSNDGGNANYIGASGVINNGESGSQKTSKEKP